MPACSVIGCKSNSEKKIKMSSFPVRDPDIIGTWIKFTGKHKSWLPNKYSVICQYHFEPCMWEKPRQDGKIKLKYKAIPTLLSGVKGKTTIVSTNDDKVKKQKSFHVHSDPVTNNIMLNLNKQTNGINGTSQDIKYESIDLGEQINKGTFFLEQNVMENMVIQTSALHDQTHEQINENISNIKCNSNKDTVSSMKYEFIEIDEQLDNEITNSNLQIIENPLTDIDVFNVNENMENQIISNDIEAEILEELDKYISASTEDYYKSNNNRDDYTDKLKKLEDAFEKSRQLNHLFKKKLRKQKKHYEKKIQQLVNEINQSNLYIKSLK